jgi:co-chaperonin GroES (HSP10)
VNFKPHKDNVVIKLESRERKTDGGIFLPDTDNSEYGDNLLVGRVVAAGPGGWGYTNANRDLVKAKYYPVQVTEGERVLLPFDAGQDVVIGEDIPCALAPEMEAGDELRVVRHNELLAVVE